MSGKYAAHMGGKKMHPAMKRHSVKKRYPIAKPVLRKMHRRAGILRVNTMMYDKLTLELKKTLRELLRDAILSSCYSDRSTIKVQDINYALKRHNLVLLGLPT